MKAVWYTAVALSAAAAAVGVYSADTPTAVMASAIGPFLNFGLFVVGILGAWAILAYPKALEDARSSSKPLSPDTRAVLANLRHGVIISLLATLILLASTVTLNVVPEKHELPLELRVALALLAAPAGLSLCFSLVLTLYPLVVLENEVSDEETKKAQKRDPMV